MTKATRKQYTLEFKQEAVRLVESGQSLASAARTLGIIEQTLGNWVKAQRVGTLQAVSGKVTLPSECVALSWAGLEDFISPRGGRGGGNVGIGFIDFQGLWEGRETALSFSSLSMNRHFHGLPRSA